MNPLSGQVVRQSPWWPRVFLGVVFAVVVGSIISISVGDGGPEAIEVEAVNDVVTFYAALRQDEARLGDPDAPVQVELFTDLRSTQSAEFQREVVDALVEEYVRDGRVQIDMRHRSVAGSEITLPAVAATAAGEQGRQWQFADLVLRNLDRAGPSDVNDEFLLEIADALRGTTRDFEVEEWERAFNSPEAREAPAADGELATELRLPAQPALAVTGPGGSDTLEDEPSLEEARAAIEAAL